MAAGVFRAIRPPGLHVQREAATGETVPHQLLFPGRLTDTLRLSDSDVATPALLCHKGTAQATQSLLLGAFLAFTSVFMA